MSAGHHSDECLTATARAAKARIAQALGHAAAHGLTHVAVRTADLREMLGVRGAPQATEDPIMREYSIPPECVQGGKS